jgi:hypothetical protein
MSRLGRKLITSYPSGDTNTRQGIKDYVTLGEGHTVRCIVEEQSGYRNRMAGFWRDKIGNPNGFTALLTNCGSFSRSYLEIMSRIDHQSRRRVNKWFHKWEGIVFDQTLP